METPKYKVGDICLIKGGIPEDNIGKVVTLVRWMKQGEKAMLGTPLRQFNAEVYSGWVVEGAELKARLVVPSTQEIFLITNRLGAYRERYLVKIGDPDTDISRVKEKDQLLPA